MFLSWLVSNLAYVLETKRKRENKLQKPDYHTDKNTILVQIMFFFFFSLLFKEQLSDMLKTIEKIITLAQNLPFATLNWDLTEWYLWARYEILFCSGRHF